ncbi:MAG TPA: radical SAM protein [Anaeromyxobacteraceae bacterium]|nr:radical SAM protein [Anaeromyxobacteraceae bacterium]
MVRRQVLAKTVLTKTRIPGHDYCVNPYVGCEHGCRYCYARFMRRFTGHVEPWGEFVDVKANAPEVLRRQLRRARRGSVLVGTVTDPYQHAEKHFRVTRGCLEALLERQFPASVLTRSPLCVRDVDLFRGFESISVGLSITTDRDDMRRLLEPRAPSIPSRLEALRELHAAGVPTYVFAGPLLPMDPARFVQLVGCSADEILIDRLNYSDRVKALYRWAGVERHLEDRYFEETAADLRRRFEAAGTTVSVLFPHGPRT